MSNKVKKILVFIDWFLPGYKAGGPIRSLINMIDYLSKDFDFYVFTRNTDYLDHSPYEGIESNKWIKFNEINIFYHSNKKRTTKSIIDAIKAFDYDFIYVTGVYSLYFSILPVFYARLYAKAQLIIATRGMISEQAFSVKKRKKKVFLVFMRLTGSYRNAIFHTTNNAEKEYISHFVGQNKAILIANNLPRKLPRKITPIEKKKNVLKLVSIARISPEKNTLFAIELLLKLEYDAEIIFDLYGSIYSQSYWNQCLKLIEKMPKKVKVRKKGIVHSNHIFSTLENYHFLFMPTQGENFGHSILESLMAACPVIISDQTPWRDLENKRIGWDISINNSLKYNEILTKSIKMEQKEYNDMREAAYRFGEDFVNNPNLVVPYYQLFL